MFRVRLLLALVASAAGETAFYTRAESAIWKEYYTPGLSGGLPASSPESNPTPLIIGASYGDAATQKLRDALNGTGIQVLAHTGVTTSLPIVAAMPGHHGHALGGTDKYTSLFRHGSKPIAIADVPVGEYVHDLLAAYPNSCVFLSLMPADEWLKDYSATFGGAHPLNRSLPTVLHHRVPSAIAAMSSTVDVPPPRQALRRYFEHNAHILASVPAAKLVVALPGDAIGSVATRLQACLSGTVDENQALADLDASWPQYLPYITPVRTESDSPVPTRHFYKPNHETWEEPFILGVGFDGTGLTGLEKALKHLNKTEMDFPAVPMACKPRFMAPCSAFLVHLMWHGMQGNTYTPGMWGEFSGIMGHPVPMFAWDMLEGFPNAKVILTVRRAEDVWDTLVHMADKTQTPTVGIHHGPSTNGNAIIMGEALAKMWIWGVPRDGVVTKKQFMRRYHQHNAKIIHGVPKNQLLVWNMYEDPSWDAIAKFIGEPIPPESFAVPSKYDL